MKKQTQNKPKQTKSKPRRDRLNRDLHRRFVYEGKVVVRRNAQASMSLSSVGNIADFNSDGSVDYIDMTILTSQWPRWQLCLCEDLDRNGTVDVKDYCTLADNWLWQE
jgi:hypothetical protein